MRTLLDVVQGVLNSAGSDEVDSITDSTEAMTIAGFAKDSFTFLAQKAAPPESKTIFNLLASGDDTKPTLMTRPRNLLNIEWVKYRKTADDTDEFVDIVHVPFNEFLLHNYTSSTEWDGYYTVTISGIGDYRINYQNDKDPDYFTSLDDNTILFDSYNATVESTLQNDKTLAYGRRDYDFVFDDNFIPFFDANLNEQWYHEVKKQYAVEIKQNVNPNAEARAKDLLISNQKDKYDMPGNCYGSPFDGLPNYGRRRR